MNICVPVHAFSMYIRRPLQSVERVRLHLLAYNIQPLPDPTPRYKAQQRTSVQPAQVARQLKSRDPALRAPRQLESRIWCQDAEIKDSYRLIFFYGGSTRARQGATGCHRLPDLLAPGYSKSP